MKWVYEMALVLLVSPALGQIISPAYPSSVVPNSSSYVIDPDDVLNITVYKENGLTGQQLVRADGMISLPLLNDVKAAGLTPMQLAASITEKLKKYLADPRVNVTVRARNRGRPMIVPKRPEVRDLDFFRV